MGDKKSSSQPVSVNNTDQLTTSLNMDTVETRQIVADYIIHRLDKSSLPWQTTCPNLDRPTRDETTTSTSLTTVSRLMRQLGGEFEQRYAEVFGEMFNQLAITPQNAQPTFEAIVNELYSDGVSWGRIVALFALGGAFAVLCVRKEMPDMVDSVLDWVTSYMDTHLQQWIIEHRGWKKFIAEFAATRKYSRWDQEVADVCKALHVAYRLLYDSGFSSGADPSSTHRLGVGNIAAVGSPSTFIAGHVLDDFIVALP